MEFGNLNGMGTIHVKDGSVYVQFKDGASIECLITGVPQHFTATNDGREFAAMLLIEDSVIFFFEDGSFWASGSFDEKQMRALAEEVSKRLVEKRRRPLWERFRHLIGR